MIAEKCLIRFEDVYEYAFKGANGGNLEDEDFDAIVNAIESVSAVDAVEVVHGEWSTVEDDCTGMIALECSKCKEQWWFEDEPPMKIYNYCPNCGAKMDGGADNGL